MKRHTKQAPHAYQDSTSSNSAVRELAQLNEADLQTKIIQPLLVSLGFTYITDTSGPHERGADLVAINKSAFGRPELYVIQIKCWKPVAKAAASRSFGLLLNQLGQTIKEKATNPFTHEAQLPDHALFFTPFPVPARAEQDYQQRLLEAYRAGVHIIDGPAIVQLLLEHCPATLATFSMDLQYRLRVAGTITRIPEARTAFEGTPDLDISRIFVKVALVEEVPIDQLMERLSRASTAKTSFEQAIRLEQSIAILVGGAKSKANPGLKQPEEQHTNLITTVELKPMFAPVVKFLEQYDKQRSALRSPDSSVVECTRIAKTGIKVRNGIERLLTSEIVRNIAYQGDDQAYEHNAFSIPLNTLLRLETPTLILGGPGVGKTTAMRWLCAAAAQEHNGPLPILVSLAVVKPPSVASLIAECENQLQQAGYYDRQIKTRSKALKDKLKDGSVRLLLDGLDEAGSSAEDLLLAIDRLSEEYPRTPIILTCRDTLGLKLWKRAFVVHLRAFSDAQMTEFITNWFKLESKSRDLAVWLQSKPNMREAARTPLVTALLCSLFDLQAEMPTTEVDLYDRRYELLLGRWEQAKGLVPLNPHVRRSYLRALETLAFYLHKNERRDAAPTEAMACIRQVRFPSGACFTAAELIEDCIRRGVLERQADGQFRLGHLTYQEYLAACWLHRRNKVTFVWDHLTAPWWRKALEFYAAKAEDITSLLEIGLTRHCNTATMRVIDELVKLAPHTSRGALNRLRGLSMTPDVLRSAVREPDTLDLD